MRPILPFSLLLIALWMAVAARAEPGSHDECPGGVCRRPHPGTPLVLFPPNTNGNTGFTFVSSGGGFCQAAVLAKKKAGAATFCYAASASHCFGNYASNPARGRLDPTTGSYVFEGVRMRNALGTDGNAAVFLNRGFVENPTPQLAASAGGAKEELYDAYDTRPLGAKISGAQIEVDTAILRFDCTRDADRYPAHKLCAGTETASGAGLAVNKARTVIGRVTVGILQRIKTRLAATDSEPPLIPGDSGGLLLNAKGEACGVLSGGGPTAAGAMMTWFASDIGHFRRVLAKEGADPGSSAPPAPDRDPPRIIPPGLVGRVTGPADDDDPPAPAAATLPAPFAR